MPSIHRTKNAGHTFRIFCYPQIEKREVVSPVQENSLLFLLSLPQPILSITDTFRMLFPFLPMNLPSVSAKLRVLSSENPLLRKGYLPFAKVTKTCCEHTLAASEPQKGQHLCEDLRPSIKNRFLLHPAMFKASTYTSIEISQKVKVKEKTFFLYIGNR